MRHLILFLFATLVFMLATPMSGSAELVSDETVVKPPGDSDFNSHFNSVQINSPVSLCDFVLTSNYVITPKSLSLTMCNMITRIKPPVSKFRNPITYRATPKIKYRMYKGYSMARLCSLIPLVNMI